MLCSQGFSKVGVGTLAQILEWILLTRCSGGLGQQIRVDVGLLVVCRSPGSDTSESAGLAGLDDFVTTQVAEQVKRALEVLRI